MPSLGWPSSKVPTLTGFAMANGRARTTEENLRSFIVKLFVCYGVKKQMKRLLVELTSKAKQSLLLLDGGRRRIESSYPCIYRTASESGSKGRGGKVEGMRSRKG